MSTFLRHQQCPACLARLTWVVCEMGGTWLSNCCFVGWTFRICSKQQVSFLCKSYAALSPFVSLKKKSVSIAAHAIPMRMLTLFSVDKMLLPRFTNFRGLPVNLKMALSYSNYLNCFIYVYVEPNASRC